MNTVEINQFNLNSGLVTYHKSIIYSNATWHKIEVENASKLDRNTVLRAIMNFVHPLDFIPVCYSTKGSSVSFLIKNCGAAIERICRHNLVITNPHDPSLPFKVTIVLNHASASDLQINIQSNILTILLKRYNAETGTLNLESFYKDPDLVEFCTLSQPKLMFYVLHLSRNDAKIVQPKSVKLSNNEIEALKPLEALFGLKTLHTLDLRNNNIRKIDANNFRDLHITDLWLEGNPICDDYDEVTYPRALKEQIPTLERLDGVFIQDKGMLPFRRNFLCAPAGHDLVDQFLEHYFNLYDSSNRDLLEGIYHKDSMISLTANYLPLQTTSLNAKLNNYKKCSRNLKMMSDLSKSHECLYRGRTAVMSLLNSLPASEHDPYTFTVDLMSYTDTAAVLVVNGVFREAPDSLLDLDRLLGFSRIFVLLAEQNDEYSIVNEQLHVYNATTAQALRAFKHTRIVRPLHIQIPLPQNPKEQTLLAEAIASITGLNTEWATKCLEECEYDMKRSLELFVDLFKLNKIPQVAFRADSSYISNQVPKPEMVIDLDSSVPRMEPRNNIPIVDNTSNVVAPKQTEEVDYFSDFDDNGDTLKLIDDELHNVVEREITTGLQNQRVSQPSMRPLPPNCKISPYGIIENYEPFMYPDIIKSKLLSRPESTYLWPIVCDLEGFQEMFTALKKKCQDAGGLPLSLHIAFDMCKKYSYHIATYQVLLLWYYARNEAIARKFFNNMRTYIRKNRKRCISMQVFLVLKNECECARGNKIAGENGFKAMITNNPNFLDAVKGYLRHLCHNEILPYTKSMVTWVLQVPGINVEAVKKLVRECESMFNMQLLS